MTSPTIPACSRCRKPGHYRGTCPERSTEDKNRERDAKKRGRPTEEVVAALTEARGDTTEAGVILGCSRQNVEQLVERRGLHALVKQRSKETA